MPTLVKLTALKGTLTMNATRDLMAPANDSAEHVRGIAPTLDITGREQADGDADSVPRKFRS